MLMSAKIKPMRGKISRFFRVDFSFIINTLYPFYYIILVVKNQEFLGIFVKNGQNMLKWGYMKKILAVLMMALTGVAFLTAVASTEVEAAGGVATTFAVSSVSDCEKDFLGFRPWYKGLTTIVNEKCEIATPDGNNMGVFVAKIILNVLADLFVAVGYLTLVFIIKGGYNYITATGDPGKIAKAKKTISSAVIGLAIVVFANVIINLIVGALTGVAE